VLHQRRANADGLVSTTAHEIDLLESEREVLVAQLADKTPRPPQDQEFVKQFVAGSPRVVEAKRKLKVAEEFLKSEEDKATDPDKDEGILKLRADVQKLRAETDAVEKTVGAEAEAQGRVVERVKKGQRVAELNTLIDVAKKKRDRFLQERDALAKVIGSTAGGAVNVDAMKKALQPQRDMADKVQTQLIQLRIDAGQERRASQRGAVDVIPNNNRNKKLALSAVSGIGCFFAVVLLVSFLEWRTRRVDGVDQVVNELGMRVIGTVPAFPNRASLQAATEAGGGNWRFVLNESINSTRTMLLHTARAQSMQVVMVTSATQGEGKTSLASQLATSMATAGMRTLLVDCDLRNPSVMKLFELPLTPGVSEVLRQEVDASEAVQATAVPNLWVIPAGQCSNATIAALAQGHPLETLFNRLRGQFDFVIVDSCPVLPVADALLIGQHVDGVVFSIMQDISQLPKVITASEKLTQLNVPLVGAVVNGIKQDIYSYGYNYVKQLPA
ncbi:MAG: polysaccharide biosynthesis tyrosine autokinase, partial [Gemmata sp.]